MGKCCIRFYSLSEVKKIMLLCYEWAGIAIFIRKVLMKGWKKALDDCKNVRDARMISLFDVPQAYRQPE